jgi:serine/threonine-protein kinase
LAEFAVVVSSQPNNADVQSGIGAVLRRQGKTAEAVEHFLRAVELNPRSVEDIWGVAQTYTLLRSPAEASRYFDRAISLGPDWRQIHYQKAMQLHLRLEGDTESARAVLEQAESRGIGPLDIGWVTIYIVDGDYQAALNRLDRWTSGVAPDERLGWVLRWYAEIHDLMGNRGRARAYYDSARIRLEAEIEEHPDEAYPRSALGMAYAGMGRTADAIREGELATELLPVSVDAWYGAQRVEDLAHIYTIVGEYDAAIDQLEALLAVPSPTAVPMLRIDPTWNPLRDHPRFQALLEKYGN